MASTGGALPEPCPFVLNVSDEQLQDLKDRLRNTRLPDEVQGVGWSQGLPLGVAKRLLAYWQDRFDWRQAEARIAAMGPQYVLRVNGIDIHYVHIRSASGDAGTGAGGGDAGVPLLLLHGWPGTFYEFHKLLPLLRQNDAGIKFDLVVPSLPGFGFSSAPTAPGCGLRAMARLFNDLMAALGYDRYLVQGGDFGALVAQVMARSCAGRCAAVHLNMMFAQPNLLNPWHITQAINGAIGWPAVALSQDELQGIKDLRRFMTWGSGYNQQHSTRPQTLGYALTDSPVGLMAWICEKYYEWSDCNGDLFSSFSEDDLLTTVCIYWLGGCITSSLRHYWDSLSPDNRCPLRWLCFQKSWCACRARGCRPAPTSCGTPSTPAAATLLRWRSRSCWRAMWWPFRQRCGAQNRAVAAGSAPAAETAEAEAAAAAAAQAEAAAAKTAAAETATAETATAEAAGRAAAGHAAIGSLHLHGQQALLHSQPPPGLQPRSANPANPPTHPPHTPYRDTLPLPWPNALHAPRHGGAPAPLLHACCTRSIAPALWYNHSACAAPGKELSWPETATICGHLAVPAAPELLPDERCAAAVEHRVAVATLQRWQQQMRRRRRQARRCSTGALLQRCRVYLASCTARFDEGGGEGQHPRPPMSTTGATAAGTAWKGRVKLHAARHSRLWNSLVRLLFGERVEGGKGARSEVRRWAVANGKLGTGPGSGIALSCFDVMWRGLLAKGTT